MRELATIVVPLPGVNWHPSGHLLLRHAGKQLEGFSFVLVCTAGTETGPFLESFPEATVYRFDTSFFSDKTGFTRLMLSEDFYDSLGWSEFILLFEPASYIVKNQLRYWCRQGHDYIFDLHGRLSLRNVDKFLSHTRKNKREIHRFLNDTAACENDLSYWQKQTRGIWPALRTPTRIVSTYFSQPIDPGMTDMESAELPFALTGFDIRSEEHIKWLETVNRDQA